MRAFMCTSMPWTTSVTGSIRISICGKSKRGGARSGDGGIRQELAEGVGMPKLPQARMYLQSAQWGLDELLTKQLGGRAFCFYLIGILACLRAVQHALMNHDSTLSDEHKRLV